jgi:hypothetical protein
MSQLGQNAKYSERVDVFRGTPTPDIADAVGTSLLCHEETCLLEATLTLIGLHGSAC